MTGDRTAARVRLVPADGPDPSARMLADLPAAWHGDVIGPGIEGWESVAKPAVTGHCTWKASRAAEARARVDGLLAAPGLLKVPVDTCNQLASLLAWAPGTGHVLPQSLA